MIPSDRIAAIVWAADENGVGAWEVGFHPTAIVPPEWIETFEDGIQIVIEPPWVSELDGRTLGVVNGYFQVI